jgi:hypothetical protein
LKNLIKKTVLLLLCLFIAPFLAALDTGAIVSGQFNLQNSGETSFGGKFILAPWLSFPLGSADAFISAGMHVEFNDGVSVVPDIFNMELSARPADKFYLRAGRILWYDPSRFVAKGRFDGVDAMLDIGIARLGISALYTGLLYRNDNHINISPTDPVDYDAEFSWADFGNTYFAPRRILAALNGEFNPFRRGNLNAGILAQFDMSSATDPFHTQYFVIRYTHVYRQFDIAAAGAMQLGKAGGEFKTAYASSLEAGLLTNIFVKERLSAGMRWSSGEGPHTAAFFPLFREAQGVALKPGFSGMMTLSLNYDMRLLHSLSADIGCRYFIRTDSTSFTDCDLNNSSYMLGLELGGNLLWVPYSDLAFSLGGGVFFPQTGRAMDGPVRWCLEIGTIISF